MSCTLQDLQANSCSHICEHVKTTSVSFICHIPFTNVCCMFQYACCYLLPLVCFVTKGQQSLSCTLCICGTRGLCCCLWSSVIVYLWLQYFHHSFWQQVNFELHHCENLRCYTELFLCTNYLLCYHILKWLQTLETLNVVVVVMALVHRGGKVNCSYNV